MRYQWKHGEFESGLALARRLENLWTHQLGSDHQQTLHLQFQIANILRSQGRFSEARELDTYVLERQRAVLGADHPHALMTANGLAADLRALGDFQQALAADQETYERFKEQFGEDYPRTLMAAHNLGSSLRLVGDCFTARAPRRGDTGPAASGAGPRAPQHPPVGGQPGSRPARGGRVP